MTFSTTTLAAHVWERLITEHQSWLKQIIRARVGESQAVDEVFQEVTVHALAQQAPLLDIGKASAWLYRVTVLQCLVYRRKAGRRRKLLQRAALLPAMDSLDPLGWLLRAERHQQVQEAMLSLPAQDAELLLLKYVEGWRYQQMADRLGLSSATVESRLHRARGRLRHLLQEKETP
jgi:RNA polymerase sigma factor (sigma-70 family)